MLCREGAAWRTKATATLNSVVAIAAVVMDILEFHSPLFISLFPYHGVFRWCDLLYD